MNNDNDAAIIDVELDIHYTKQALEQLKKEFMRLRDQSNKIFEETGDDFAKNVANKGSKALADLESKIKDVTNEVAKITNVNPTMGALQAEKELYLAEVKQKQLQEEINYSMKRQPEIKAEICSEVKNIEKAEKNILALEQDKQRQLQELQNSEKKNLAEKYNATHKIDSEYAKAIGNEKQNIENSKLRIATLDREQQALHAMHSENYKENQSNNQKIADLKEQMALYDNIKNDAEYRNKLEEQSTEKLQEQLHELRNITNTIDDENTKIREANEEAKKRADAERAATEEIERRKMQIQREIEINNAKIAQLRKEKAEVKENAARYYYLLRAVKMAKYGTDVMYKAMDRFQKKSIDGAAKIGKLYLKLASSFITVGKAIGKLTKNITSFGKASKSTTRSHDGFVDSLKRGIWTVIKYTFGIRSLYFLFRKLRAALNEGMENLATQFPNVNEQMSSLISSLLRMKNAVAAAVQPLLNVLVPALERLSEAFSKAAYYVGSFFAALTGQDFVYYAKKVKKSYIEDEKAAKAKKDLNDEMDRQLSGLDKLNVLTTPKNKKDETDDAGGDVVDMFDTKKLENKFKDLLDKIKKFLKPITDAWAKEAEFVKNAWKYAWEEVVKLAKDIWRDFLRVWFRDITEKTFENIFHTIGDIGLIIGNLAKNIRKAWNASENGYRILSAIGDMIYIISQGIRDAADYTVEWSEKLNFVPLFTAIADVLLLQVVPAVQKVVNLFVQLYEDVLLELLKYFVEQFAPVITRAFGNLIEAVGNLAGNFLSAWNEADRGKKIIQDIEDILNVISGVILDVSEKTKEWAAGVNFAPALDSIHKILVAIKPFVEFIATTIGKFWTDILLPMAKDFVEKTLPKIAQMLEDISGTIDWPELNKTVDAFFSMVKSFFDKYGEVMLSLIEKIANKLIELVNSGVLETIFNKVTDIIDKADPNTLANIIVTLGTGSIALKGVASGLGSILDKLIPMLSIVNGIKQAQTFTKVNEINGAIKDLTKTVGKLTAESDSFSFIEKDIMGVSRAVDGVSASTTAAGGVALSTVAIVVAAIALVTAAVITLWKTDDKFKTHITETWNEFKTSINESLQSVVNSVNSLGYNFKNFAELIKTIWINLCKIFAPAFEGAFKIVTDRISGLVQVFSGAVETITGLLHLDLKQAADGIGNVYKGMGKTLFANMDGAVTAVKNYKERLSDANEKTKEWVNSEDSLMGKMRDANVELNQFANNTDYADAKIEEWVNSEESLWGNMRDVNTEINTFSDNLSSTSGAVDAYAASIETTIPEANAVAAQSMTGLTDTAKETATQMQTEGKNVASGFAQGIELGFDIALPLILGPFGAIISLVRDKFATHSPSKVFDSIGRDVVQGFVNGILAMAQAPITAVTNVANRVINAFRTTLAPSRLVAIGKNLLSGLANGIRAGISSAVSAVRNAASSVIGAARSAFQVHSPSKIFEGIGEMLTEGLAVGVEKDTDDLENAFDDMVPDNAFLDMFYEKFIGMLSSLREESVNIVSSMIDEIESTIAKMDNLAMLEDLSTKLSNISEIKVPDIASGTKLPENEKFAQQPVQQTDLSNLPAMLKSAFVEAFMESGALQNDDGDIIIQLNGNEIFREIRRENDKYRKQHGMSAFA
jgi:predicted  nucleic acid-binding Zn-ribbon protein